MIVNKILFITLSNIGDVVLTLPVFDYLKRHFPNARITVISGPRPGEIFRDNPGVYRHIVYDKNSSFREQFALFKELQKEQFEVIIDFKNSFLGFILFARYKISPFLHVPVFIRHMKDRHFYKLQKAMGDFSQSEARERKQSFFLNSSAQEYVNQLFSEHALAASDTVFVIAPGARSEVKRWPAEFFSELIRMLIHETGGKIILVGDRGEMKLMENIIKMLPESCRGDVADFSGKTTITQTALIIKRARLLISNDSAVVHLAGYCNVPTIGIYGPTDETKYGPWSENFVEIKKEITCRPCEQAQCRFGTVACLRMISAREVMVRIRGALADKFSGVRSEKKEVFKRILITRTDRMGDVILSTPVIRALREAYPSAYIAMMVSPQAVDIIKDNPFLDEIIIFDKNKKHAGLAGTLRCIRELRQKNFDLAVILHPIARVHYIAFLSGIKKRIGFNRKMGLLLTDRIPHDKQRGEKHESEYTLDVLSLLKIIPSQKTLFVPVREESEVWVSELFKREEIRDWDRVLVIHPSSSCLSRIWPPERFARVADILVKEKNMKAVIIGGPAPFDIRNAANVAGLMVQPVLNLAGKITLSRSISVIKKAALFISVDTGPVHIASALNIPQVVLFGRNQKGLSPVRWGPLGYKNKVLHRPGECEICLAHDCTKNFACLKAITVEDVIAAADELLASP